MSEFTDQRARRFYADVMGFPHGEPDDVAASAGDLLLDRLTKAGWRIERAPKPRFYVHVFSSTVVQILDRLSDRPFHPFRVYRVDGDVESHDDTVVAAQAEADRLNREAGQ